MDIKEAIDKQIEILKSNKRKKEEAERLKWKRFHEDNVKRYTSVVRKDMERLFGLEVHNCYSISDDYEERCLILQIEGCNPIKIMMDGWPNRPIASCVDMTSVLKARLSCLGEDPSEYSI